MTWATATKASVKLGKFRLTWVDLSGESDASVLRLANRQPAPEEGQKAENLWFEANMEVQRRA